MPTAGSVYDYIACGLGRVAAITGTISAYMLVHAFAGTAETILSGLMATVNFDAVQQVLDGERNISRQRSMAPRTLARVSASPSEKPVTGPPLRGQLRSGAQCAMGLKYSHRWTHLPRPSSQE